MEFDYKRLKVERIIAGYTMQNMADLLKISRSCYSKKERGKSPITIEDFIAISKILGIDKEKVSIFFTHKVYL